MVPLIWRAVAILTHIQHDVGKQYTVYVNQLPYKATEEQIHNHFKEAGWFVCILLSCCSLVLIRRLQNCCCADGIQKETV